MLKKIRTGSDLWSLAPGADAKTLGTWSLARRSAQLLAGALLVGALSACGSSVKLQDEPTGQGSGSPYGNKVPQAVENNRNGPVLPVQVDGNGAPQSPAVAAMERVIYFDYDSFEVRSQYTPALEAHAQYLAANRDRRLALEGHADERGGREYNLALGQKRSEAVRRALGVLGVPEAQIEAVSFGEEKPAVVGFDEAAFAKNRRVEFTYRVAP